MSKVMGYCDPWSVAAGETVRFMVSCLDGDRYMAEIVRLKQPDAGPLATAFAPEPVAAPCNGVHTGRYQRIPIGSCAVVPQHPALAPLGSFTLTAWVLPTTPTKSRQAIMGTWREDTETGYGLEIDATGALSFRCGAGCGRVTSVSMGTPLVARRWYFVAASYDSTSGTMTVLQEPVLEHFFDSATTSAATATANLHPAPGGPLTFAAWSVGPVAGPSAWGGLGFTWYFNGRIDSPRLAGAALDRAGIRALATTPLSGAAAELIGAWDFSRDIPSEIIRDLGPWQLDGVIINQPTRAVPGWNWDGHETCWKYAPSQYGAIHFHEDDLVDACWEPESLSPFPRCCGLASMPRISSRTISISGCRSSCVHRAERHDRQSPSWHRRRPMRLTSTMSAGSCR
jgi:N,N-dimethylformamidase